MKERKSKYMVEQIKTVVTGRIIDILNNVAGIPIEFLDGKNHPCPDPACGGKDRFRLIDADAGAVLCNQCFHEGNGDFIAAVMHYRHVDFQDALKLIGDYLGVTSTQPPKNTAKPTVVSTHDYQNADGTVAYQVRRFEPGRDGKPKECIPYHLENGQWKAGNKDIELVPLHLPELLQRKDEMVFIVEGEKCSDALTAAGLLATTASGGSNSPLKWANFLTGRIVIILPDNDRCGYDYADRTATALYKTNTVKVVKFTGLKEAGDIVDWFAAGHSTEELLQIVEQTPIWNGTHPKTDKTSAKKKNMLNLIIAPSVIVEPHLSRLLEQIQPVNFRRESGLKKGDKIPQKTHIVISVSKIIDTAIKNDWGLCTKNGYVYIYTGNFWQLLDPADFKQFLASAAMQQGVPILDGKHYKFRDELFKQFTADGHLSTPHETDSVLINLQNGTFEITDTEQKIRPPERKDFLKYQLPFAYQPDATASLFQKYLDRVLPNKELQFILSEYCGYLFVSNLKLEKVLILYGSGANGKSVFFEILKTLLGSANVCSYSLSSLTSVNSYQRSDLQNRLLNYASEINGKLESDSFKLLASGEPIEARRIYGEPFIMERYAKLIFNCNSLPTAVENSNAFFRRFLIIPFSETIPESEQDPELSRKVIADELPGVFNWILDGLRRLLTQKRFTQSTISQDAVDEYQLESDTVKMFVSENNYTSCRTDWIPFKELYEEYKTFCFEGGYRPCFNRTAAKRLRLLHFEIKRVAGDMVFYGKKSLFSSSFLSSLSSGDKQEGQEGQEGRTGQENKHFFSGSKPSEIVEIIELAAKPVETPLVEGVDYCDWTASESVELEPPILSPLVKPPTVKLPRKPKSSKPTESTTKDSPQSKTLFDNGGQP